MKILIDFQDYEEEKRKRLLKQYIVCFCIATAILMIFLLARVNAQLIPVYSDEQIAKAIYLAEGGNKTRFPYGIKSINTRGDKDYAKKICLNTIKNQRKRHASHHCKLDFIACLGNRYCPINSPDDNGTNKHWIRNVRYFLERGNKR